MVLSFLGRYTTSLPIRIIPALLLIIPLFILYNLNNLQDLHLLKALVPSNLGSSKYDISATYEDTTKPIFPPISIQTDIDEPRLCSNFPQQWLKKVQVVFKTGVGEGERNEAHLNSVTSCISNLIVISDFPEQKNGHDFIDVLADLPKAYSKHPDFAAYYEQYKAHASNEGNMGTSNGGWKLDRFKFLPMMNVAHEQNPNAEWYLFLEADVYVFWDNLFRLLDQYDSEDMHYFGSAVAGAGGRWFAYGGAGFVLSHGLMKGLIGDGTNLSKKYQKWALDDCCGDAVLGYVIYDKTGVKVESLYPMMSGETLAEVRMHESNWCTPLVSLHHVSATEMKALWLWERTRKVSQTPILYSTILTYRHSHLHNTSHLAHWDNFSSTLLPQNHTASTSALTCAEHCEFDPTCLQYSYSASRQECRTSTYIVVGRESQEDMVSGWDRHKMRELGGDVAVNNEDYESLGGNESNKGEIRGNVEFGCQVARWNRPRVHWWSDSWLVAPMSDERKTER